nr:MAG TPA: hypothetical protein [Caudoviricetes sp.]
MRLSGSTLPLLLRLNLAYVLRGVNSFYRVSNPSHYLALA